MNTKLKYLIGMGCLFMLFACHKEDALTPGYEYSGAIPSITDGPSAAQKICYELYRKFDLQVYYTLEGKEALRTIVGWSQNNNFNPLYLPLQAGDENISTSFLTLLKKFHETLPLEMAKATLFKRQLLVKGTIIFPWDHHFENYRTIAASESEQGVVYYGNMEDESTTERELWKYSITFEYFRGITNHDTKGAPLAKEFGKVSKGEYWIDNYDSFYDYVIDESYDGIEEEYTYYTMDEEALLENGFVNPRGFVKADSEVMVNEDLATYATWITLYPKEQRQDVLDTYPLVKRKYELTLKYFKEVFQIDLEKFSNQWSVVTI